MEIQEIKDFSKRMHKKLESYYNFDDPRKLNLPMTVKIMEELGELCDDVLAHSGIQRKEKLENKDMGNLQEEFADVILTTCNLAENMGIDIEEALRKKIKKVDQRFAEE
jgi:NTP pyrophosphatase (non-canonical NTP hydrolase)